MLLLLEAGARMDLADKAGQYPLTAAAALGEIEIVDRLLALIADPLQPEKSSPDKPSPLMRASKKGHTEVVRKFLSLPDVVREVQQGIKSFLKFQENTYCLKRVWSGTQGGRLESYLQMPVLQVLLCLTNTGILRLCRRQKIG